MDLQIPKECQVERRAPRAITAHGLLTAVDPVGIGQVVNGENFSSYGRLLSITANVLKYCQLLLSLVCPDVTTAARDDLDKAEAL